MSDKLDGLIISELLVDNPSGGGFDTDGDGTVNKSDEFIEIQNTTGTALSLDGYEIWSEKSGLLYSFGAGDTIDPGGTATVVGEYTGAEPDGIYDAGVGEGTNWLADGEGNKFDSIFLVNSATGDYVVLSYGQPPRAPTLPNGFPGTNRQGAGESLDSSAPNGTAFSRNADGDFAESSSPTPDQAGVACYAPGMLIETVDGPRAVETLRPGMFVLSLDHGPREILWTRADDQPLSDLPDEAKPILIPADALGPGRPTRDLIVSPQHRILVGGQGQIEPAFKSECLVPAKSLISLPGIRRMRGKRAITWIHFACAGHEVVFANGCATESLLLGPMVLQGLGLAERHRLRRIFGSPPAGQAALNGPPARQCLTVQAARRRLKSYKMLREWDLDSATDRNRTAGRRRAA